MPVTNANLTRRRFNYLSLSLAAGLVGVEASRADETKPAPVPFLRGTNFCGMNFTPGQMWPVRPAVDYYVSQKRMNVIRLCLLWELVQPELNGPIDPEQIRGIQDQIDRTAAAGSYIILELHNYGRRTIGGHEFIIGETPTVTGAHFADVWTKIAQLWRDNPKVIFELINEPHDQDSRILVDVTNATVQAIRSTGARNLIMICGNNWNSLGWLKGGDNQRYMLEIEDPLDHFCFDVHHYFDEGSAGQTPNVLDDPIASMKAFTDWAKEHGKMGFCGEFGCAISKRGMDACRALLDHIEGNKDVYLGWCWLGSGGCWQPDYVFLLDPFAAAQSPTNPDPAGSVTWKNAVDRPQMGLLQEYLPHEATPFNAWLIEDQLPGVLKCCFRRGDYQESSGKWIDSGSSHHDATVNSWFPPKVKPHGGFDFASDGQLLSSDVTTGDGAEAIYAIIRLNTRDAQADRTILGSTALPPKGGRVFGVAANGAIDVTPAGSPFAISGKMPMLAADARTLIQAAIRPAETVAHMRKSLAVNAISSVATEIVVASDIGTMVIGAADPSGKNGFDGTIYELAVFADISDDDDARVQGRLCWDNGLAHLLPRDHPYRVKPPSKAA